MRTLDDVFLSLNLSNDETSSDFSATPQTPQTTQVYSPEFSASQQTPQTLPSPQTPQTV